MEWMRQEFISGMQQKRWMWSGVAGVKETPRWPWSRSAAVDAATPVNAVGVRATADMVQSPAELISSFGGNVCDRVAHLQAI